MSDFNSLLIPSKKLGGLLEYYDNMTDLVDFIGRNALMDVDLTWKKFTWSNIRKGKDLIQVRLDKFVILSNWGIGPSLKPTILPRTVSDHNPLLL